MTSSERMLKLMAYADGELEGDDRAEIEKLIASDADAAKIVNQMASLGEVVKAIHPKTPEIDFADAIMKKVENEKIDAAPPAKVVPLSSRRRNVGMAVVAALALAASVFVMTRQKDEAPLAQNPVVPAPIESNAVNASAGPGVEVEAVESPGHSVSVFYLPTANELSTSVVVWVDETGENK